MAQSTATTSSPYSRYGLGLIDPVALPQNIAMGGITAATNNISGYNNINPANPASYSNINLTTIDIGLYSNIITLSKTGYASQTNSNFRLGHVAFGIPISKHSAFSFGLMPYSELGYKYTQTLSRGYGTSSPADTNVVNNIYSGEGGLSKAHLGYGIGIGKHLSVGANASYIFGDLKQYASTEFPVTGTSVFYGAFNSRQETNNYVSGLNYDYGAQYTVDFSDTKHLTFGYSGSASTKLNTQTSFIVSQYQTNYTTNVESPAADTVINQRNNFAKIVLPQTNRFGIAYKVDNSFLIGADYSMGQWSKLTINGVNQGLQNTSGINVGGQFNPNYNSLNSYWALVDYRLGAHYEKTSVIINNQSINQYGVTFGLGLPLARNGTSFYKVNFAADIGRRGTLDNALIRETYINLHLSFTLNDKWFTKYKFD